MPQPIPFVRAEMSEIVTLEPSPHGRDGSVI